MADKVTPPPPIRAPIIMENGSVSPEWVKWFTLIYNATGGAAGTDYGNLVILLNNLTDLANSSANDSYLNAQPRSYKKESDNLAEMMVFGDNKSVTRQEDYDYTPRAALSNGAFRPVFMTDTVAFPNTVYYSTTLNTLVYKSTAGVVNPLF